MQRDVVGYIDATIKYERENSKQAPPGGYADGLDRAEADLVYLAVRRTLEAVGYKLKPEWFPPNSYQAGRLDNAYRKRGLNPTKLVL